MPVCFTDNGAFCVQCKGRGEQCSPPPWIAPINPNLVFCQPAKRQPERAASHRDLYAPNRLFFPNTAIKCHGRRQPCRGILSCLEKKSLALECFAVLNRRFFFTVVSGDRRNTGCIPRATGAAVEEKIHSKPCKSLCESAQGLPFFICALRFEKMCDRIILLTVKIFPYWLENQYIQTAKEKL